MSSPVTLNPAHHVEAFSIETTTTTTESQPKKHRVGVLVTLIKVLFTLCVLLMLTTKWKHCFKTSTIVEECTSPPVANNVLELEYGVVQCGSGCYTGYHVHMFYACNSSNDIVYVETEDYSATTVYGSATTVQTYTVPTVIVANTNSFCKTNGYPDGGVPTLDYCTARATGWCPYASWILGSGIIFLVDAMFFLVQFIFYRCRKFDPMFRFYKSIQLLDNPSKAWLSAARNCWIGWADMVSMCVALIVQVKFLYGFTAYVSNYAQCSGNIQMFGYYASNPTGAFMGFALFIVLKECIKINVVLGLREYTDDTVPAVQRLSRALGLLLRFDLVIRYFGVILFQSLYFTFALITIAPLYISNSHRFEDDNWEQSSSSSQTDDLRPVLKYAPSATATPSVPVDLRSC